jgi:hypothetical protein
MRSFMWVYKGPANIQSDVKRSYGPWEIGGAFKAGYIYSLTDH